MTDIVLNGVSIAELKKQKALIQKDASAFIAKGIADATALIKSIVAAAEVADCRGVELIPEQKEEIQEAARLATSILEDVKIVSAVSNVPFYLPFYEEYGYADERPYTAQLDDALGVYDADAVIELHGVLEDMEYDSRNWHSSRC